MANERWFLNENLEPYPYDLASQAEAFPNDFHKPYLTQMEAMAAANLIADIQDLLRPIHN